MTAPARTVAILCGGRGTRLQEHTRSIPKALVEIGGRPILWHVVQIYAAQGFDRFLLCAGHKAEMIEHAIASGGWPEDISIECLDTGGDTPTGGRIKRIRDRLPDGTFCVTYADGVADVDLRELCAQHSAYGGLATVTVVRPTLPFGVTEIEADSRIASFHEKPRSEHWINGGFFCFEPGVLDYLDDDSVLERDPLEQLARDGELYAYRHTGFWDCMDTYKDALLLNDIWANGGAPWRVWAERAPLG